MNGEEFLNRLYKDLNLSAEVKHTAKGTKDKNEAVELYENCEDGAIMVCDDHVEIWDYDVFVKLS